MTFEQSAARTRAEWLEAKAKSVSSTESPALFGMSPYLTAFELGVLKQKGAVDPTEDTERIVWGKRLQDSIAQGIADDYGVIIEGCEYEFLHHATEPHMGSSLDYRILGFQEGRQSPLQALYTQHGPGLLEIKNVDSLVYKNWPDNDAPDHIEIQVQHQMEVARVEWCVLGVLVGGNRTEIYTRLRDGVVGAAIASKIHKFWHDLEQGVLPPAVMPEDADLIIKMNQYAEPTKVLDAQGDIKLELMCGAYLDQCAIEGAAAKIKNSLKAQILQHIGDAEKALATGFRVSASMVAEAQIPAHVRSPYRYFKVTKREGK